MRQVPYALGACIPNVVRDMAAKEAQNNKSLNHVVGVDAPGIQELVGRVEAAHQAVRTAARKVAHNAVEAKTVKMREANRLSKSERTRARILAAASDIIRERGGIDFQIGEVAERCNISKGALYYYFADRDAIVEELFSQVVEDFVSSLEIDVAHASSSHEAMRAMVRRLCYSVHDGGVFIAAMATALLKDGTSMLPRLENRYTRVTHLVSHQLIRAQREGLVNFEGNPEVVAASICGMIFFGASRQIEIEPNTNVDELIERLIRMVEFGISASHSSDA